MVQRRSSLYYSFTFNQDAKGKGFQRGKIIEVSLPVTWHDFLNLTIQIFIMDNVINKAMSKGSKKEFRKTISAKLESSLVEFRNDLKEKKFKAAVKRASKLLANDLFVKQKKKKEKDNTVLAESIGA